MQLTTSRRPDEAALTDEPVALVAPAAGHGALRLALGVGLIALLGTALRAIRLGYQSLWYDEILTLLSSTGSILHVLTQTEVNTNVPQLYYLVVNRALALGSGEEMLRLPSMLAGSLSIPLVYLALRRWTGARIAFCSAVLVAVSPFLVWYSQEARPYALFLLLAMLALWCFKEVLENPDSRAHKIGFVLATAASFHAHTIAVGLFVVLGLLVLAFVRRKDWPQWIGLATLVALLILPAIYRLMTFPPTAPARADYEFSLVHVGYAFWTFSTGYSLGPSVAELHGPDPLRATLPYVWLIVPAVVLFAVLCMLGVRQLWRSNRGALLYLLIWLGAPLIIVLLGTIISQHAFNVRYAILSAPAFLALVAAGLQSIAAHFLRRMAWGLVLLVSAASLGAYYFDSRYHREDTRAAAAFLRTHAQPGDIVVVSAPYMTSVLEHYLGRADVRLLRYPESGERSLLGAYAAPEVPGADVAEDERIAAAMRRLVEREGRYWLFLSRAARSDPRDHLQNVSDSLFARTLAFDASGVRLRLYTTETQRVMARDPIVIAPRCIPLKRAGLCRTAAGRLDNALLQDTTVSRLDRLTP